MPLTTSGLGQDRDWDDWVEVSHPSIPDDSVHVSKSDLGNWSLPLVEDGQEDEDNTVLQLTQSQEDYRDRLLTPKVEQLEKELQEQTGSDYSAIMEMLFSSDAKDQQLMFNAEIPELLFQPRHSGDTYSPRSGVIYTLLDTADKRKDAVDLLMKGMRTRSARGNNTEGLSLDHPPSSEPRESPKKEDMPSFTHSPDDVD
ncbi:hypothetical protein F4814DRAFT_417399 [Daldinia grandis]|nr:hypothetical protein F4814DRAFT_417399 [Daldinia grandis]